MTTLLVVTLAIITLVYLMRGRWDSNLPLLFYSAVFFLLASPDRSINPYLFYSGIVLALVLVLAMISIQRLGVMHERITMMAAVNGEQVRLSNEMKLALTQRAVSLRNLLLFTEPEEITPELAKLADIKKRYGDTQQTFATLMQRLEITDERAELLKKVSGGQGQIDDLEKQMWDVEMQLVSRSEIHSDDKYFPEAYKVYMNLIWLSGAVGQGASDEAGGVDWKPTDVQYQVTTMIEGQIAKAKLDLDKVKAAIPAWNTANAAKGLTIK